MVGNTYTIEWRYLEELADGARPSDEAYCSFLVRFTDRPPGPGHCWFFGVNVVTPNKAHELDIPVSGLRAYLVVEAMVKADFQARVTNDVQLALSGRSRDDASALLDATYVFENQDFRNEFAGDAPSARDLITQITEAFQGVTLGNGVSLHQAIAADDYAGPEAYAAARALDTDTDWRDAPREVMASRCEFFSYLDGEGFRYYIPAAMCFSVEHNGESDTPQRTYWSLLPTVAPRDFGKGHGQRFDCAAFIARCGFNDAQIRAVYAFLCFMAVAREEGVDEEQLPAMRAWRTAATFLVG